MRFWERSTSSSPFVATPPMCVGRFRSNGFWRSAASAEGSSPISLSPQLQKN